MNTINNVNQTGDNITNAMQVVMKTYESVEKLLSELDLVAPSHKLEAMTPKFLRWKSDAHASGWLITSFIKLYQSTGYPLLNDDSGLRNGPIYVVDITLHDDNLPVPTITLAKNIYDEGELYDWGRVPTVSEHWGFYYPTRETEDFRIEEHEKAYVSKPLPGKKEGYWNLDSCTFKR